jgi:diguanylate cyclase (GGDEF)-like protein
MPASATLADRRPAARAADRATERASERATEPAHASVEPRAATAAGSAAAAAAPPRAALGARLGCWLLGDEPQQRMRLAQAGLAMALLALGVAAMHYFVWIGHAPAQAVAWWSAVSLGGMAVFFLLIRSGWSRRHGGDPALAVPQMVFAIGSGAVAYTLLGAGRGGVFPIVMVVMMFGMFGATPRQMAGVGLWAVGCFGMVMAWMGWRDPVAYPPAVELGHFLMVATMMPAASLLAARLARMRERTRQQRAELTQALARIRELATRDELTGLANDRHMQALLAQEHQRCVRSGQTFCVAVLDIDELPSVHARHGAMGGDRVVQAIAQEAQRQVRVSDVLARSAGDRFVLLMPETRAALARGGVERLQRQLRELPVALEGEAMRLAVSAGLAEHRAGETALQTLQRAKDALREARAGHGGLALAG